MAILLQKTTQLNVGIVVRNAITSIRAVRSQEQSRKESLFQQAVADGMSYEDQVNFRQDQLAAEETSGFRDPEYINTLKASVSTTKRLKRFYDYRQKYQSALAELNSGSTNAVEYAKTLKKLLGETNDSDLSAEIQTNITDAETKVTAYKNTVLSNQVKLAEFDGTEKTLSDVIRKVQKAKAISQINGNDDEVEAYNLTLASLNSQKVQAKAEDVVNDIAVSGMLGVNNSSSKLKTLGMQINDADDETPITINGKRFSSEKQYWEITRSAYLSGNGAGVFADYFSDLETQYKQKIDGETARYGFVQPSTIQKINSELTQLRSQPEMAPFIERIDGFRAEAVASAVSTVAKTVVDRAQYTGDFTQADTTLKGLAASYQVDTTGYQLQLGNILNQQVNASIAAGEGVPAEASLLPASDFAVPSVTTELTPPAPVPLGAPGTPANVPGATTPSPAKGDYSVVSGDSLSGVAAKNNMSLSQLLDLNPQYKANPNDVSVGANLKLTSVPVAAPVTSASVPVSSTPTPKVQPTVPSQALKDFSVANAPKPQSSSSPKSQPSEALRSLSINNAPKQNTPAPAPKSSGGAKLTGRALSEQRFNERRNKNK